MQRSHKDGRREPTGTIGEREKASIDNKVVRVWDYPSHFCRSCKKLYSNKANYKRHIKKLHGEVLQEAMQLSPTSLSAASL